MEYSVQSNPEMSYIDLKNMHLPGSKAGPKAGLPKGSAMNYLTLRLEHFFWTPPSPVPAFHDAQRHTDVLQGQRPDVCRPEGSLGFLHAGATLHP